MSEENPKETSRVEAFSDGVFAIAMTLLIIEIKLPPLSEDAPNLALLDEACDSPRFRPLQQPSRGLKSYFSDPTGISFAQTIRSTNPCDMAIRIVHAEEPETGNTTVSPQGSLTIDCAHVLESECWRL
jgi:hypothetical protein